MRILVTGASGFVGKCITTALAHRNVEVFALSRKPVSAQSNTQPMAVSLLDFEQTRKAIADIRPACVVHLAWDVSHGSFYSASTNLEWVGASLNLYRGAVEFGANRFVGIGSCAEYAPAPDTDCDETTTSIAPASLYGASKDAFRRVAAAHAQIHGTSFAWARLFNLFGPGEDLRRLVPSVCLKLIRGSVAPMSSGSDVRDFIDVRDAGEALAQLALSNLTGEINIGSGRGTSVADVANCLANIAGRPDLLHRGALPDRASEPARLVANTERLNHQLGFSPSLPLGDRLHQAYQMWEKLAVPSL